MRLSITEVCHQRLRIVLFSIMHARDFENTRHVVTARKSCVSRTHSSISSDTIRCIFESSVRADVRSIKESPFLRLLHHQDISSMELKLHLPKFHLHLHNHPTMDLLVITILFFSTVEWVDHREGSLPEMFRRLVSSQSTRPLLIR